MDPVIEGAIALVTLGGVWGVVRYKTDSHAEAIKELRASKAELEVRISLQATEIAVLKSQAEGSDRRLTESMSAIEKSIAQSEQRVISHFDSAVQALRGNSK
jgi:hypothetical protein